MKIYKRYLIFILTVLLLSLANAPAQQPVARRAFKQPSAAIFLPTRQAPFVVFSAFQQRSTPEPQSAATAESEPKRPVPTMLRRTPPDETFEMKCSVNAPDFI